MELTKTKFKKTEIGLIPEDWGLKSIDEIFKFYPTSSFAKAEMTTDGKVGCFHYGLIHSITNTKFSLAKGVKYYVSQEQARYEFLKDGDVVMVDASEDYEGINKSIEVNHINGKNFIAGLHTFLMRDSKDQLADNFRGLLLNSRAVKNQMLRLAVGLKVYGVSKNQLKQILLPIPTLTEQKAIATALSDVDEMIAKLEKLIEKKKAIKQGAMQQLLTPPHKGGKRLEGFSGEWVEVSLDEVAELKNGYAFKSSEYDDKGAYTVVTIANVQSGYMDISNSNKIALLPTDIQKHQQLLINDILISMTGNVGRVCLVSSNHCLLNQRVGLIAGKGIDEEFLYFRLCFNDFTNSMIIAAQGGAQPNIGKKEILGFRVFIPPSNAEQKAISTIIKTISDEILSLKKRLNKLSDFKQGMMQELLTGRTRLI